MLKPKQNKFIYWFFSWYIDFMIKKDFKSFIFNKVDFQTDKSILLLSNHFSWWDGFLLFQINRLFFNKKFHVMVTEENYRKISFLRYLGGFSIKKNSRSAVETLRYAGELLNDPNNLVLIFPQGKLYSNHITDVKFEKGLIHLINFSNKSCNYVFVSMFTDYFESRKPFITCYLQNWKAYENIDLEIIKSAFNNHYEKSRQQHARTIV